jgi:hypothetical protein
MRLHAKSPDLTHAQSGRSLRSCAAARPSLGESENERQRASLLTTTVKPAVNKLRKLIVSIVTPEAVILWTGLLAIVIVDVAGYMGSAALRAEMRNSFGQLSVPIRIAIFAGVGVTLWLLAFAVVARAAARLRYAFDPAYETQRTRRRWVQQLRIGDRLRLTDRGKDVYCTISRVDAKKGESFEVIWNDGNKNMLSYFDADLFDEIALGDAGRAARPV